MTPPGEFTGCCRDSARTSKLKVSRDAVGMGGYIANAVQFLTTSVPKKVATLHCDAQTRKASR